jgi:hypothetical protein
VGALKQPVKPFSIGRLNAKKPAPSAGFSGFHFRHSSSLEIDGAESGDRQQSESAITARSVKQTQRRRCDH